MILNDVQMRQILDLILQRTLEEKLDWNLEDNRLFTGLPNQMTVELAPDVKAPDFLVQVKGPSGELYGRLLAQADMGGELYRIASERAGKTLFIKIMDSLKFSDSAGAVVVPAPRKLTPEQADLVLKKMEGQWALDYSYGKELASIKKDGAYFLNDDKEPRFRLKVLAWNEATSTAEVAKDKPDGKRHQIEYLTITRDAMAGHAKHDGHKLTYRRVKG